VARVVPELRRRFTSLPAPPSATPDRWRLFEGIAQLLLALADENPLVVLLDDLQWYDADSCALLHVLVRRLEDAPVLWCATMTLGASEPEAQPARLYRALRARPRTAVLTLAPLSEDDVWQVVRELGRVTAPNAGRRVASRIHQITAGNPFYVIELLKTLFAQRWLTVDPATGEWVVSPSAPDGALSLSSSVHDAIAPRVECLPAELRSVLITIAVADRGCRTDVLSHVHGISRLHAAALGDALLERHLVVEEGGTYRCAHPVIAHVVRDGLSTARRREVHREIAFALALDVPPGAEPADPGEIARHAEQGGEPALAYRYAMMATRSGVTRYAYDEALSWLDLAAGVASTPADASAVDGATAELLRLVGGRERPPAARWPAAAVRVLERGDLDLPART
jgi:predicted ATPase